MKVPSLSLFHPTLIDFPLSSTFSLHWTPPFSTPLGITLPLHIILFLTPTFDSLYTYYLSHSLTCTPSHFPSNFSIPDSIPTSSTVSYTLSPPIFQFYSNFLYSFLHVVP